jgi:hypothetical protein
MIEYDVAIVEQFAYRMGQEFSRVTWPEVLVNFERVAIWTAYHRIRGQQNHFIQRVMNIMFEEGMRSASMQAAAV